MSRIRIKDIARLANVSTGTVDRVLHNRDGVSEETRERVVNIIQEYDYQPDILAGVLASGRSSRFLVCMPEVVSVHEFWKYPEKGVLRAIDELQHFGLEVEYIRFDQHSREDFERRVAGVDPSEYDGLLFAPVFGDASKEFLSAWESAGVPFVLFNSRLEGISAGSFIGQDAFQSGFLGGKLMSYGLSPGRDLLIVNLSLREYNYQHILKREQGFRSFFEEHNNLINNLVTLNLTGGDYGMVATRIEEKLLQYNVAGIFVTNSRVHLVARYLSERGSMNIRLVGYDLLPESVEYVRREYIDFIISQSPEEQAYLGLKHLFSTVVLKKTVQKEILLPIDILTRENIDYYLKFNSHYEKA